MQEGKGPNVYSHNFLGYICNNWLDGRFLPEQTCNGRFEQYNVCLQNKCSGVNLALKRTLQKQTGQSSKQPCRELNLTEILQKWSILCAWVDAALGYLKWRAHLLRTLHTAYTQQPLLNWAVSIHTPPSWCHGRRQLCYCFHYLPSCLKLFTHLVPAWLPWHFVFFREFSFPLRLSLYIFLESPLTYITPHTQTHTEAAKSSTRHAASNLTHSEGHKSCGEYSIPTATCCIPSPGGDSATQHHNQIHKLNWGARRHMKDSPLWLPSEREAVTLHAMSKCQVKPLICPLPALLLYPWVHLTQHFKWEWIHSFIFCVSLNVTFFSLQLQDPAESYSSAYKLHITHCGRVIKWL